MQESTTPSSTSGEYSALRQIIMSSHRSDDDADTRLDLISLFATTIPLDETLTLFQPIDGPYGYIYARAPASDDETTATVIVIQPKPNGTRQDSIDQLARQERAHVTRHLTSTDATDKLTKMAERVNEKYEASAGNALENGKAKYHSDSGRHCLVVCGDIQGTDAEKIIGIALSSKVSQAARIVYSSHLAHLALCRNSLCEDEGELDLAPDTVTFLSTAPSMTNKQWQRIYDRAANMTHEQYTKDKSVKHKTSTYQVTAGSVSRALKSYKNRLVASSKFGDALGSYLALLLPQVDVRVVDTKTFETTKNDSAIIDRTFGKQPSGKKLDGSQLHLSEALMSEPSSSI